MANENVSVEDVTATVLSNAEDVADSAKSRVSDAVHDNPQVFAVAGAVLVAAAASFVTAFVSKKILARRNTYNIEELVVVSSDEVVEDLAARQANGI